jgi:RTX toxin acyltransferase family
LNKFELEKRMTTMNAANDKTNNLTSMNPEEVSKLAEMAKSQATRVMAKIPLLGPVTWLMMQQGITRHTLLSELEWRVLPALVLDQAKLYMRDNTPIAYVSWAKLSPSVVERTSHRLTTLRLRIGYRAIRCGLSICSPPLAVRLK